MAERFNVFVLKTNAALCAAVGSNPTHTLGKGELAQLVEYVSCTDRVKGSKPLFSILVKNEI